MSTEDNEWLDRQDHPLLKYTILNGVFKHLNRKDFKACRLVCKTWNVFTVPFTRKAFKVTIYGTDTTKKHTLKNFIHVFRSNKLGIPFGRYRLGSFCTTFGVGQEFLELCGDAIKEIEFKSGDEYKVEYISELLKSTPNLESFVIPQRLQSRSGNIVKLFPHHAKNSKPRLNSLSRIYESVDNSEERNKFCPTFLEELMTAGENISYFFIHEPYKSRGSNGNICTTIVEVLSLIEKLGRESSILELNISHEQSDHSESFELLRRMAMKPEGLRLKKLTYSTLRSNQDNCEVKIASLFKDSLESLDISLENGSAFQNFPKIKNLQSLCLCLPEDFNSRFINLKEFFPVLQKLTIYEMPGQQEYVEFFTECEPCPTIQSLKFDGCSMSFNPLSQIHTVFPNLTKLSIWQFEVGGAKILRHIWSQMTQLKSLIITGVVQLESGDSMDSILTGIPTDVLQKIKRAVNNLKNMDTECERREMILELRNEHSQFPSITNLTNLSHFYIHVLPGVEDGNRWTYLTDLTGYLGFYSMPRLKNLAIQGCKMSKTCCEILKEDIMLETWKFEDRLAELLLEEPYTTSLMLAQFPNSLRLLENFDSPNCNYLLAQRESFAQPSTRRCLKFKQLWRLG